MGRSKQRRHDLPMSIHQHRQTLKSLAESGVFLGTSSWKYPGWLGQLYDEQRYLYRGKVAKSRFERDCLEEYAEVFSTVCVDAGYYRFPSETYLEGLASQVPDGFKFSFKVTEEITVRRFPRIKKHGDRGGEMNDNFLNSQLFKDAFLKPLHHAMPEKTGLLIFEFSRFKSGDFARGREFVERLDQFFSELPRDFDYGVEIRNASLLEPSYFEVLERHGVGHVYNHWQRMPGADEQLKMRSPDLNRSPAGARLLLKPGRAYSEAVDGFSPYDELKEPQAPARRAAVDLIRAAL